MKKVKTAKEHGTWYYEKIMPTQENGLDAPIFELYDANKAFALTFGSYGDMRYYIKTGRIL